MNIDAHRLWASCAGRGSPTVVFEGGAGSTFEVWKTVQAQLAPSYRVCSYDRAGLGRSDRIASPETAGSAAGQAPDLDASDREIEAAPAFPNIPLIVLAHGKPVLPGGSPNDPWEKAWRSMQVELAGLSPQVRLEVAERSDHSIPTQEPHLVVGAVADLTRDRHQVRKSLPV